MINDIKMCITFDKPPVWQTLIDAGFTDLKDCIFTYGNVIYNPDMIEITPELLAHETMHARQQAALTTEEVDGRAEWWNRWILDRAFRAEQEAQGYGAQYAHYCKRQKDRNWRAKYLHGISLHLSGGIYLLTMKQQDARAAIQHRANV